MERIYFLHGFMGTAETHFREQITGLEDKYELILFDLPGHGTSSIETSENYFEDSLQYVINQMKEKGEGYILGLSLGASLAIHIAFREPELVRGIILTGYTPFIPENMADIMAKQYEDFSKIEENNPDIANHFRILHGDKWKRTLDCVNYTMTFHYPTATKEQIQNIKTPMLILNGSNELYEVEAAAYLKKMNNDTKIALVPDAGHTANIDQPIIYNTILEHFLRRITNNI